MKTGDLVKIELGIKDPVNKQGEMGKVVEISHIHYDTESEKIVKVQFEDGVEGMYFENCLSIINDN